MHRLQGTENTHMHTHTRTTTAETLTLLSSAGLPMQSFGSCSCLAGGKGCCSALSMQAAGCSRTNLQQKTAAAHHGREAPRDCVTGSLVAYSAPTQRKQMTPCLDIHAATTSLGRPTLSGCCRNSLLHRARCSACWLTCCHESSHLCFELVCLQLLACGWVNHTQQVGCSQHQAAQHSTTDWQSVQLTVRPGQLTEPDP